MLGRDLRTCRVGGADGDRTRHLMTASHARSQLRYSPIGEGAVYPREFGQAIALANVAEGFEALQNVGVDLLPRPGRSAGWERGIGIHVGEPHPLGGGQLESLREDLPRQLTGERLAQQ